MTDQWIGLELRHLTALQAIAETGSFKGAAGRLGYTPSAISQQIAGLERIVGTQVIAREHGRKALAPRRREGHCLFSRFLSISSSFVYALQKSETRARPRARRAHPGPASRRRASAFVRRARLARHLRTARAGGRLRRLLSSPAAVRGDDQRLVCRRRRNVDQERIHEGIYISVLERGVVETLEADRRERMAREPATADGPAEMARVDDHPVWELEQLPQRAVQRARKRRRVAFGM
ncbi:MAG: LysR family transcriptional regulator [Actinobacteria bacterium]|nr:LysR family transcriptional regulator [Actinomycetota bacterium]